MTPNMHMDRRPCRNARQLERENPGQWRKAADYIEWWFAPSMVRGMELVVEIHDYLRRNSVPAQSRSDLPLAEAGTGICFFNNEPVAAEKESE